MGLENQTKSRPVSVLVLFWTLDLTRVLTPDCPQNWTKPDPLLDLDLSLSLSRLQTQVQTTVRTKTQVLVLVSTRNPTRLQAGIRVNPPSLLFPPLTLILVSILVPAPVSVLVLVLVRPAHCLRSPDLGFCSTRSRGRCPWRVGLGRFCCCDVSTESGPGPDRTLDQTRLQTRVQVQVQSRAQTQT